MSSPCNEGGDGEQKIFIKTECFDSEGRASFSPGTAGSTAAPSGTGKRPARGENSGPHCPKVAVDQSLKPAKREKKDSPRVVNTGAETGHGPSSAWNFFAKVDPTQPGADNIRCIVDVKQPDGSIRPCSWTGIHVPDKGTKGMLVHLEKHPEELVVVRRSSFHSTEATEARAAFSEANGSDNSSAPSTLESSLRRHFIDVFEVSLKQISLAAFSRQLNEEGLDRMTTSMRDKGWLPSVAPVLVVSRESLPNGEFTRDCVGTANYICLDGNHRIQAAKKLFDKDKTVPCRVYYAFDVQSMRLVGDALNDATEAHTPRTTFDSLFFYRASIGSILEKNPGKTDVTAQDMANSYSAAGLKSPSLVQLRSWKRAVCGISNDAFSAVEKVFRSRGDKRINKGAISLNFLVSKGFLALKDEDPTAQALAVYIMARYSFANKISKEPKKKLVDYVVERAAKSALLLKRITSAIPPEEWSENFEADVENLTRGALSVEDFKVIVEDHMASGEERIAAIRAELPESDTKDSIMADFEEVARSKLPRRLEVKATRDSRLRRNLEKIADRAIEVDARIARAKLQKKGVGDRRKRALQQEEVQEVNDGSGDDDDDNDVNQGDYGVSLSPATEVTASAGGPAGESRPAKGSREKELCPTCKAGPAIRYHCIQCGMRHLAICTRLVKLTIADEDARDSIGMTKRMCLVCRDGASVDGGGTARPKKKRNKRTLCSVEPPITSTVEVCRGKNTVLHEGLPLTPGDHLHDDDSVPLPITTPPKLIVVAIDAEKALVRTSGDSDSNLRRGIVRLVNALHSSGTIVFTVPRPWLVHGSRIRDVLAKDPSIAVEESLLLVTYNKRCGGSPKNGTADRMTNSVEAVLLAHRAPKGDGGGGGFTVNNRITMNDPYGNHKGAIPEFPQCITGLSYPPGAPNGGPRCALPARLLQVLVGRYSSPGDTVLGVGVETTQLPEITLDRGRRLELFLVDKGAFSDIQLRINNSFLKAFDSGLFRMDMDAETYVGPSLLPSGLPADVTPEAVKVSEGTSQEDVENIMLKAAKD